MQLAELGKAGKAIRATSPGLAEDTIDVENVLTSKFPERAEADRNRPIAPHACAAKVQDVVAESKTFTKGAGPGPTGFRPQFLQDMIGDEGDEDALAIYTEHVQLFIDGKVPKYLRKWFGGGKLVGTGKDDKPLTEDARPLVVGETWRRLAAKVALRGEKVKDPETELAGFLQPNQCAVGVKAGAEIIVHTLRQWCERHKNNTEMAALKKDNKNAFNTADEHEFLQACHEYLPGCAELAEWCYGEPVNLVYHGRLVTSYKGQQGCPLMMPMYCVMQQKMRKLTPSANRLSIKADYADDGIDGGSLKNLWWNTLQEKIA